MIQSQLCVFIGACPHAENVVIVFMTNDGSSIEPLFLSCDACVHINFSHISFV